MATATRKTPRRSTTGTTDSPLSSPSRGDDMTLVVPFTRPPDSDEVFGAPNTSRGAGARQAPSASADNSLIEDGENENDNFTMVLPQTFAHERAVRPGSSGRPGSSHRPSSSGSATHIPKPTTPRLSPRKGDTASPMGMSMSQSVNRLRPDGGRSPERHRSPLPGSVQNISAEAVASPGAVQVYEDPFTSESSNAHTQEEEKPVLEELPIERANERLPSEEVQALSQSTRSNEQNIDTTQPRTPGSRHHKTTSTGSVIANGNGNGNAGSDNAETLRSRRLLTSGIERIRAKTLDAHGFRRVQDIVKSSDEGVWGDNASKFGELLTVLLEYLEAPNDSLKVSGTGSAATKAQSLKGQVLATIRAMLSLWRREASAYYSRSLVSVLVSRRQWEESMHITADIEKTAEEIVRFCSPVEAMGKVLDLLEQLGAQPASPASASSSSSAVSALDAAGAHRTASFALSTLGSLLSAASARGVPIDAALNKRLGACGVKYLQDPDSDVRKADLDFLLVMHEVSESDVEGVEKSRFW
ncbi:MAG: hypothetical protein INR71_09340, partial [Terriglobus roseus]|nr:hypothetical protein [Terriglobus roseus]